MDSYKISETKGCSTFCTGPIAQGASRCLCVASKKFIYVYEINRTKTRHKKMKEILCPNTVQFVELQRERLVVGYASTFAVYSVQGEGSPLCKCSSFYLIVSHVVFVTSHVSFSLQLSSAAKTSRCSSFCRPLSTPFEPFKSATTSTSWSFPVNINLQQKFCCLMLN